jgi:hypothetical protein
MGEIVCALAFFLVIAAQVAAVIAVRMVEFRVGDKPPLAAPARHPVEADPQVQPARAAQGPLPA